MKLKVESDDIKKAENLSFCVLFEFVVKLMRERGVDVKNVKNYSCMFFCVIFECLRVMGVNLFCGLVVMCLLRDEMWGSGGVSPQPKFFRCFFVVVVETLGSIVSSWFQTSQN